MKSAVKRMISTSLVMYRKRGSGDLHLTFDDGPHPENTPIILEILERHSAGATFFLQGDQVERHPGLVKEICRRGHAVGSHLFSHRSPKEMSTGDLGNEMERTEGVLRDAAGVAVRWVRPPYGDLTVGLLWRTIRRRQSVVLWSFDSEDSFLLSREQIFGKVSQGHFRTGDILLFHEDCRHTVEALPRIMDLLAARGYNLASL